MTDSPAATTTTTPTTSPCPQCHIEVRQTDYFCFNCGKNLHPAPPSTSISTQLGLYLKSFLIPPFGIFWGFPYLLQPKISSKLVGLVTITLTLLSLYLTIVAVRGLIDNMNEQITSQLNSQLQNMQTTY